MEQDIMREMCHGAMLGMCIKKWKANKFYKLYEKEYDTARNKYKYYIHDVRNDVKIPLEDEKQLYTDDKINVNGISKDYFVHKYKLCDPGFDFD